MITRFPTYQQTNLYLNGLHSHRQTTEQPAHTLTLSPSLTHTHNTCEQGLQVRSARNARGSAEVKFGSRTPVVCFLFVPIGHGTMSEQPVEEPSLKKHRVDEHLFTGTCVNLDMMECDVFDEKDSNAFLTQHHVDSSPMKGCQGLVNLFRGWSKISVWR